jgi:ZIP family zinc transporter
LLVLAITLHNIPEGLAIGVAFGAAASGVPSANLAHALTLAFGVAIQDFPEGLAVALPLRREGTSRLKSFFYGAMSAAVEPVGAAIGAAAVVLVRGMMPYALGFSAGAMLFVIVEELIPESQRAGNTDLATLSTIFGFALMMVLEVTIR